MIRFRQDADETMQEGLPTSANSHLRRSSRVFGLNGGSSTIKFALFDGDNRPTQLVTGTVDRIGSSEATIHVVRADKSLEVRLDHAWHEADAGVVSIDDARCLVRVIRTTDATRT